MVTERPIRAALIGCGDISVTHLKAYQAVGIEVAALCDVDAARAERRRVEFGLDNAHVTDKPEDIFSDPEIDFVTVATPVAFHAPLTLGALRAGKHVACEKPSALSLRENQEIVDEARRSGRMVFFFSSSMRYGAAALARQYVDDGDLGDIYRVSIQYLRRRGRPGIDIITDAHWFHQAALSGGGIIMDMGQYFMDMVLSLTGWPEITAVSATTFQGFEHSLPPDTVYDVEEHCTVLARTSGRISFSFDFANIVHQAPVNRVALLGTKGGILMDDKDYFTFYSEKGGPWRWMDQVTSWRDRTPEREQSYRRFVQAIRGEGPPIGTTPEEALAITRLTQMALLSAREGREVRPDDLPAQ